MKRQTQITVVIGLVAVAAMLVAGTIALRSMTLPRPPGLSGEAASPPTLEDVLALARDLKALGEEVDRVAAESSRRSTRSLPVDAPDHLYEASMSHLLGMLALQRMKHYVEHDDPEEASVQRMVVRVSASATRAHLQLARREDGDQPR